MNKIQSLDASISKPALVTVIIPCYNQAHFLGEAIESILAQTYRQVELIVVDDGSYDQTVEVAARYPGVLYIRQNNQGLAAARNTGLRNSQGQYLVFLDSDDRLLPEAINTGVDFLCTHPDVAFVSGCFRYIHRDGSFKNEFNQEPASQDHYLAFLQGNYVGMHATVMYRREILETEGGFNPSLPCCEDYDLYLRIARKYSIARHHELVAEYRQHDENMSADSELMLKTVLSVLHSQWGYVKKNRPYREAYHAGLRSWREYYSEKLFLHIAQRWSASELSQAAGAVGTWIRYAPRQFTGYSLGLLMDKLMKTIKAILPPQIYNFLRRKRGLDYQVPIGGVNFGELRRLTPLSREFGYDRGLPIDRYYIDNFLALHAKDIRGRVLEIGDDSYTRRFGGNQVDFCDVLHVKAGNPQATIVADLATADHIPSNTFDCIVLTQTLHLIYDVKGALHTLYRILKPGGVLLTTFPGISQISIDEWAESWFWSFTVRAAEGLFQEYFPLEDLEIKAYGNVLAATSFLYGLAYQELNREELDYHDPLYQMLITVRAVKHG